MVVGNPGFGPLSYYIDYKTLYQEPFCSNLIDFIQFLLNILILYVILWVFNPHQGYRKPSYARTGS